MSPIALARAMRRRGWRYQRRWKGLAAFGIGFPNGRGATRVIHLKMVGWLEMSADQLADFFTCDAALQARWDLRREAVPGAAA